MPPVPRTNVAAVAGPVATFAIVAPALFMSSVDATVVAVGLNTMTADLNTNLAWMGWTLTGYQLTQTVAMPVAGRLSDEWGRKRLFLAAVLLFTLSSVLAGLSPNVYALILCRVVQAIGGGAFMPAATGLVCDAFDKRRATALGLFTSIFPLGGILGPNLGGFIIDNLSWHWIFYVNVPIGLAILWFGWRKLRPDEDHSARQRPRFDVAGVGLFAGALLALMLGLTRLADYPAEGFTLLAGAALGLGVALLAALVWNERRAPAPLIEVTLLTRRPSLASNAYNFLFGASVFGFFSFIPYYAQVALGLTAGESGIILTPRSLAMAGMSFLSSTVLIRFGYRAPMVGGALLVAAGLLAIGVGPAQVAGLPSGVVLSLEVMLAGLGMGLLNPASNNAALDLLPGKVAAVAGLRGMFRSVGGVIGTALLVLALSHFEDKAAGLRIIFAVCAALLVITTPIVFFIPDTARERRQQGGSGGGRDAERQRLGREPVHVEG